MIIKRHFIFKSFCENKDWRKCSTLLLCNIKQINTFIFFMYQTILANLLKVGDQHCSIQYSESILRFSINHSSDNLVSVVQSRLSDQWLMAANVFTECISLLDLQNLTAMWLWVISKNHQNCCRFAGKYFTQMFIK